MSYLVFFLACIGMTHIITKSSLFGPIRKILIQQDWLPNLIRSNLTCDQCAGFWIGNFLYFLKLKIENSPIDLNQIIFSIFFVGSISSILADLAYRLKQYLCKECG